MTYKYLAMLADRYRLVLGSRSPRRVELLKETGVTFRQLIPDLEELQNPDEPPFDYAERLARDKATLISAQLDSNEAVIGCDTVVVLDNKVLGKPESEDDAARILLTLSGKQHVVCTALAIADKKSILASGYEVTCVRFKDVSKQSVREYIATGEPMDKAGAYGIQGMGAFLVDSIDGNLDTVIGFPRLLLEKLARKVMRQ